MVDFSQRADLSELMDGPCSYEELRDCLRDIAKVNRLTMAYRPTLQWLERVVDSGSKPLRIVDVGCGYGCGRARATWSGSHLDCKSSSRMSVSGAGNIFYVNESIKAQILFEVLWWKVKSCVVNIGEIVSPWPPTRSSKSA